LAAFIHVSSELIFIMNSARLLPNVIINRKEQKGIVNNTI